MIVARLPPLGDNATFKLTARSLFDKGGFCDGDLFRDEYYDYGGLRGEYEAILMRVEDGGVDYASVKALYLRQEVVTCHNPIRCFHVEGTDDLETFRDLVADEVVTAADLKHARAKQTLYGEPPVKVQAQAGNVILA